MLIKIIQNNCGKNTICKCDNCGKIFNRIYSETVKKHKSNKHFCCNKCYRDWNIGENHFSYGKKLSKEHRDKLSKNHWNSKGSNNPSWKGGELKHYNGYIIVNKPEHPYSNCDGYIYKHRLIMEESIGRYLKPEEVVHHINGIIDDNRIENLMLFANQREHIIYHKELKKGEEYAKSIIL